jgi:FtsX-like permease family
MAAAGGGGSGSADRMRQFRQSDAGSGAEPHRRNRRANRPRSIEGTSRAGILIESLVVAFAGGLLGIALAETLVWLLVILAPVDLPRLSQVHIDWRVLLFALAAAAVSGLLFGLFPAWQLTKVNPKM